MLIQITISNFMSFNKETTFSMFPTSSQTKGDHIIEDNTGKKVCALPICSIYGANASGKSNFISAIEFLQEFVLRGEKITNTENEIPVIPFLLDESCLKKPSRFELLFKFQGVAYTYGFVVSTTRVEEEWLFAYYTSKESLVFIRKWNKKLKQYEFDFGSKLRSSISTEVAKWTSEKSLFLSFAYDKKPVEKIIAPIYQWFQNIVIVHNLAKYKDLPFKLAENEDFARFVSKYLSEIDTGINNITVQKEELTEEKLQSLPAILKREIEKENIKNNDSKHYVLTLLSYHQNLQGKPQPFSLYMESDGTIRILHLLPILYLLTQQEHGKIFFIDELDNSLHPVLSYWFLENFLRLRKNSASQLIFSTHDTNLLTSDLFRKDEICFTEKDDGGATHFVRFSEYKTSDGLNWENGYISGRFGGIPVLKAKHEFE